MDNNSVEMQAKENNPKKNGKIAVCCCIVAAICIVVATVLVMHFRNSDGAAIAGTDTTESESNSDQSQDNETEAETEAPKPEFEISETGVLTAYNGDDEAVVIPDNVISIGEDAFGTSPYADEIRTVKLGKSIEDIDVQAFVSLTKLENVEVPEENSNFISGDGVLIKTDNSVFFCMPSIIKYSYDYDDYDMFDVFYDAISDNEDAYGTKQIILGGMIANVNVLEAEKEIKDSLDMKYNIFCNSFYANGQKLDFNEPLAYIYGTNSSKSCRVFETNQGVVLSNTVSEGFGDVWILTEDSIAHAKIEVENYFTNMSDADYNYSVINFRRGKDGSLKYLRRPYKFTITGGTIVNPYRCTGFDEFAGETGNVKIENGEIIYSPNRVWTVKEDPISGYLQDVFYLYNYNDAQGFGEKTLEEFLAHNAEIYESAK